MANDLSGSARSRARGEDAGSLERSTDAGGDIGVVDVRPDVPTLREKVVNLWRRSTSGEFAKVSAVVISLLTVIVLAVEIIRQPVEPVNPAVVAPVEPPAAAAGAAASPAIASSDRSSIESVLRAYRDVYDRLDARSAALIWPRADTRALSLAFSTLSQQDLSFHSCALDIAGASAEARCVGEIRYVRRVGDQVPRVRPMSWSFALERVANRWQIAQVTAN